MVNQKAVPCSTPSLPRQSTMVNIAPLIAGCVTGESRVAIVAVAKSKTVTAASAPRCAK
jgi:hypothetical protein